MHLSFHHHDCNGQLLIVTNNALSDLYGRDVLTFVSSINDMASCFNNHFWRRLCLVFGQFRSLQLSICSSHEILLVSVFGSNQLTFLSRGEYQH